MRYDMDFTIPNGPAAVKLIAISKGSNFSNDANWYDIDYFTSATSGNNNRTLTFLLPCSGYIGARGNSIMTVAGTAKLSQLSNYTTSNSDDVYSFTAKAGDTLIFTRASNYSIGYEIFAADDIYFSKFASGDVDLTLNGQTSTRIELGFEPEVIAFTTEQEGKSYYEKYIWIKNITDRDGTLKCLEGFKQNTTWTEYAIGTGIISIDGTGFTVNKPTTANYGQMCHYIAYGRNSVVKEYNLNPNVIDSRGMTRYPGTYSYTISDLTKHYIFVLFSQYTGANFTQGYYYINGTTMTKMYGNIPSSTEQYLSYTDQGVISMHAYGAQESLAMVLIQLD